MRCANITDEVYTFHDHEIRHYDYHSAGKPTHTHNNNKKNYITLRFTILHQNTFNTIDLTYFCA